ncbi:unnamed protein product [Pleuronectes platessa]|uniref:Uncharacterized protein n=1 Tax=Pleuronectes platessa TaxID=8262 RepID=A0A9N7ZE87_PLEPL|nr:unnamed protein product [Pleuronectes platessa]
MSEAPACYQSLCLWSCLKLARSVFPSQPHATNGFQTFTHRRRMDEKVFELDGNGETGGPRVRDWRGSSAASGARAGGGGEGATVQRQRPEGGNCPTPLALPPEERWANVGLKSAAYVSMNNRHQARPGLVQMGSATPPALAVMSQSASQAAI